MKYAFAIGRWLFEIGLALMVLAVYMVFLYAPTERTMGIPQRIFYVMVPSGWLAMLSFTIIFVASIGYLKTKDRRWDVLAQCSGQLGILFTTLTLITGSLWARPAWGVYWTWEPRLTFTLLLWLIYVAYFMVRSFAGEESRGAAFAAVVGIVGFVDVPIIGLSTSLWRGMHPGTLIFQSGGLDPKMLQTLLVSLAAFTALWGLLLAQTLLVKNAELEVRALKESLG